MRRGKGLLCPRCDRYTFRPITENSKNGRCSKCDYEGPLPDIVEKENKRRGIEAVPITENFPDPTKLYTIRSATIETKLDMRLKEKYKTYILSILPLGQYEADIMSCLLAATSALSARNLMFLTNVPRTKVYGTLKKLNKVGLVHIQIIDIDKDKLPDIFPYWPEHKQNNYLKAYNIGLHVYTPNREAIEEAYNRNKETFGIIAMNRRRIQVHETYVGTKRKEILEG